MDLHNFKDRTKDPKARALPIPARMLDENFTVCRLKVAKDGTSENVLTIKDKFPCSDEISFSAEGYVLTICIAGAPYELPVLASAQPTPA